MDLKVNGKVVHILAEQTGEGRNGTWRKRDFVIETQDNYPKKICITQWGDDIEQSALAIGDMVTVHIDVQSNEFKGRWYTNVKAWRIEKEGQGTPGNQEMPPEPFTLQDTDEDDLPF